MVKLANLYLLFLIFFLVTEPSFLFLCKLSLFLFLLKSNILTYITQFSPKILGTGCFKITLTQINEQNRFLPHIIRYSKLYVYSNNCNLIIVKPSYQNH